MAWKVVFRFIKLSTTVLTSIGTTPYSLVYGTKVVIHIQIEILSLQIIMKAEIDNDQWFKIRLEKLSLIDEKLLMLVCHGQLHQKWMTQAYNKKVYPTHFEVNKLVLEWILPH